MNELSTEGNEISYHIQGMYPASRKVYKEDSVVRSVVVCNIHQM